MSYPPGGYPPQQYPPQQPQGYPQPQQGYPQPGYPQPGAFPPAAYQQPQQQPQQGNWAQPAPQTGGYDFGTLYGQADHSASFLYPEDWFDAVVEDASYGRSKDGTKEQWTIKFRTTTGENAGRSPITTTLSISPTKKDGTPNPIGLGIMFRQLGAMGVPVTPTGNPQQPGAFWEMKWTGAQVAEFLKGKPCRIKLYNDEYDGTTRNKVGNIAAAKPGAPTDWPRGGVAAAPTASAAGYAQPAPPQYPQPQPQWQAPDYMTHAAGPAQYGQPQAGPVSAPPGTPPAQPAGPQPIPGAPQWAQPPTPGQGGFGEFTQQGQSQQPSFMQPQEYPMQPQQPQYPQGPPPPAQFQPPQPPPGYPPQQAMANGSAPVQQPAQPPLPQQPGPQDPPPWAQ